MVAEGWNGPVSRVKEKALDVRVREGQYLMDVVVNNKEEEAMYEQGGWDLDNIEKLSVKKVTLVEEKVMITKYDVVTRNNKHFYAESVDGESFQVLMSNDTFRAYTKDAFKSYSIIPEDDEEAAVSNQISVDIEENKEEIKGMKIYHFLREMADANEGKQLVRIVATHLQDGELDAFKTSMDNNVVAKIQSRDPKNNGMLLLALNTGSWQHVLLQKRLADQGKDFRLMSVDHVSLAALGGIGARVDYATLVWADSGHTQFLKVFNSEIEWGAEDLGMVAFNTKKLSKRNKEITRQTKWFFYSESTDISVHVFESDKDAKLFDGMGSMSREFATKMGIPRRVYRINARFDSDAGVAKGDLIISDDQKVDLITYDENIKRDLCVIGGWVLFTAFEHKPYHFSVWDDQSMINNKAILNKAHQMRDIETLVQNVRDALAAGEIPSWIDLGEEAHTDSAVPTMDQLSDRLYVNYVRWQVNGFDIRAAQNLVFMAINGIINRMNSSIERKKMWLPISNAFTGSVNTYEGLTQMCRISLPRIKKDVVFFDKRYGVVIPGKRFIETFDLHGTWDLDDTAKFILIKLWSSNGEITEMHRNGFTIPSEMNVPDNSDDAILCVAVIRSPNGPGEFSIELIDEQSMIPQFHNLDMSTVSTVDLVKCALPQSVLLEGVEVKGMTNSVVYDGAARFSRENAKQMIKAQSVNPGIGNICNALMHWANAFGPSFPNKMLDVLGNMVDATEQGADIKQFEQITAEVKSIYNQYITKLLATPEAKVDVYLLKQRPMPDEIMEKIPQSRLVKGRLADVYTRYNEAIEILRDEILMKSLQMRLATPLVSSIRGTMVGLDAKHFADRFAQKFNARVKNVDTAFTHTPEYKAIMSYVDKGKSNDAKVFVEKMVAQMRAQEMSKIVGEMVHALRSTGEDCDRMVIGLYKFIVSPMKGKPLAHADRIIFQPGNRDQLNVMDLLISALKNLG